MQQRRKYRPDKALAHVHLQWFSDPDEEGPLDISFQGEDEDEEETDPNTIEVPAEMVLGKDIQVVGGEDEKKEEEKKDDEGPVLSGLKEGFSQLNENLGKLVGRRGGDEDEGPIQKPGESEEDFWKRVGPDVFDEEKMPKAMRELVARIVGPQLSDLAVEGMEARRDSLQAGQESKDFFEDFSDEIEKEAKKLVKQHGPHPRIYRVAYETVRQKHSDYDVKRLEEKMEEEIEKRVAERLDGKVQEGQEGPEPRKRKAAGGASLGVSSVGVQRKVKRVLVTDEMKQLAKKMGVYHDPKRVLKHFGG